MKAWVCCARPAPSGKTCYHVNRGESRARANGDRLLVPCQSCGATKHASDDRRTRRDLDTLPDEARFPAPPVPTSRWTNASWAEYWIQHLEGTK